MPTCDGRRRNLSVDSNPLIDVLLGVADLGE